MKWEKSTLFSEEVWQELSDKPDTLPSQDLSENLSGNIS
ncbi:hypothetical protein Nos7107_0445 [Nostoc sp. PCC 7107]|nr:hypothetical protein Nos7107_0445 [Nostoc sp. PCC 7107]